MSENNEALGKYIAQASKFPRLGPAQEKELSIRIKTGDRQAAQQLVESNLLLVVSIAKHYYGKGLPLEDLIQEGSIGLMTAAERYDSDTGNRFSTFATYWIKQAICRALANYAKPIRIPCSSVELAIKIHKATEEFTKLNGRQPNVKDLALLLDMDEEKIEKALCWAQVTNSLDEPVDDNDNCLGDMIPDIYSYMPSTVERKVNQEIVEKALGTLSPREEEILRKKFGIGCKAEGIRQLCADYGLSASRIQQIQDKAIQKLRNPFRQAILRDVFI